MNIANLPTKNNYSKLNKALRSAAFNVATVSMARTLQGVKSSLCTRSTECDVSVYGSWQKRGYVSMNDCVTAISIDAGEF